MRSIHLRLMIFFCSLLILTLVTMGIYSYRLSSSVVEEKTSAAVLKSLEQQAKNLNVQMQTVKKYMDLVIYTPEFMNVVETNSFDKTSYNTVAANGALYFGGTIKADGSSETEGLYLCYGRKLTDYNSYQNTDVGSVFLFMDIKSFSTIINDLSVSGNVKIQ